MDFLEKKPSIVVEAQKARFNPNVFIQFLLFLAVFVVSNIVSGLASLIYIFPKQMEYMANSKVDYTDKAAIAKLSQEIMSQPGIILASLFATAIVTVLVIVYCKFIEKRSLYSMGFVKKKAVRDYLLGMVIGFVMFSGAVLICYLKGTLTYGGFVARGSVGLIIAFFFGYLLQGMSEEVLCRGYFMVTVATKKPAIVAILANSLIFALLHILNNGVNIIPIINIFLIGIFFSVYMLKSDSIWGVCAIHSIWNFVQGGFYGLSVSGMANMPSIFRFEQTVDGQLFNGGSFGLEGGLAVTAVTVLATVFICLWKGKSSEKAVVELNTDISADESIKVDM